MDVNRFKIEANLMLALVKRLVTVNNVFNLISTKRAFKFRVACRDFILITSGLEI